MDVAAIVAEVNAGTTPAQQLAQTEVDTDAGTLRVCAVRLPTHPDLPDPSPFEVVVLDGDGADLASRRFADESQALAAYARYVAQLRDVGAAEMFAPPFALHYVEPGDLPGAAVPVDAQTAREAGFTVPVQLTPAAWRHAVQWGGEDDRATGTVGQSEAGRLWDVLSMARLAVRRGPGEPTICVSFVVSRIPRGLRYPGDDEVDDDVEYENARLVFLTAVVAGIRDQRRVTISLSTE